MGRRRAGNWAIAERRCIWWRRPTRSSSIARASARTARRRSPTSRALLRERRQVQELPAVRLRVTEHQALHVRCPECQRGERGSLPRRGAEPSAVRAAAAGAGGLFGGGAACAARACAAPPRGSVRSAAGTGHAGGLDPAGGGRARARGDAAQGGAAARAGAAQRRDRRAARWAIGLGACGQHPSPHALRHPRQTGSGSDRRHWHPARLHRRECA